MTDLVLINAAGNCDPKSSNSTFLFGYSTELSPNVVTWVTEQIVNVMLKDSRNYKNYANVRLDNKNGIESIHSHSDIFAFSSEVNKNLPNPNLAYPSPDNQTDLFGIIRNFINSPAFTLCGSRLFFLLHRLPQADSGADRIIDYQKLIENDVQIFLIKSRDGDGGIMNPLYRLAANTSGLLSYAVQSSFPMVAGSFLDAPYRDDLLFSYNSSDMKKNGTYYLGTLKVPESSDPTVNLTLAITTEMSPGNQFLISFDLILENKSSGVNQTLSYNRSDEVGYSDLIYRDIELDSGAVSEVYATIYNTWYSIINKTTNPNSEEEDEFCNIGEKHSTFLFAYATDFDTETYSQAKKYVVNAIAQNRHNYTKLASARFDTKIYENITFHDDLPTFSADLNTKGPNGNLAADSSKASNVLDIIRAFLSATGRPLESSMIVILANRFPDLSAGLTDDELDAITNNNVKIYIFNSLTAFNSQKTQNSRSSQQFSSLAANSNGHFIVGESQALVRSVQEIMARTYIQGLTFTRNLGSVFNGAGKKALGTLKVPRSASKTVKFYITVSVENSKNTVNTTGIYLRFSQAGQSELPLYMLNSFDNSNFYFSDFPLQAGLDCQISYQSDDAGTNVLLRFWTESVVYHYGSFAALDDPMGGNPLSKVDEFNGAALRMRLMNDCYSDHAGSIIITDCNGQVSSRYDATQNIPTQYIFADEGSFPHYPFVPFFCDSQQVDSTCISGAGSKYDIQFVASQFSVVRSFQCRKGVGSASAKCQNVDADGNYYCDRDAAPYRRGPTGRLLDCLGRGHLEFDFDDTQDYVCVCDKGFGGDSCEKSA